MKIVVIGGTGLIGSKLVNKLGEHGHEAVAASPDSGVNTLTGEGLATAAGADTVVDVSNSPSFEEWRAGVLHNLHPQPAGRGEGSRSRAPRRAVGRGHRAPGRERLLPGENRPGEAHQGIGVPYSIVHATQFFEFVKSIAQAATDGDTVRLSHVLIQPMAAEDVATAVAGYRRRKSTKWDHRGRRPRAIRSRRAHPQGPQLPSDPREVVTDPTPATSARSWPSARSFRGAASRSARRGSRSGRQASTPASAVGERRPGALPATSAVPAIASARVATDTSDRLAGRSAMSLAGETAYKLLTRCPACGSGSIYPCDLASLGGKRRDVVVGRRCPECEHRDTVVTGRLPALMWSLAPRASAASSKRCATRLPRPARRLLISSRTTCDARVNGARSPMLWLLSSFDTFDLLSTGRDLSIEAIVELLTTMLEGQPLPLSLRCRTRLAVTARTQHKAPARAALRAVGAHQGVVDGISACGVWRDRCVRVHVGSFNSRPSVWGHNSTRTAEQGWGAK